MCAVHIFKDCRTCNDSSQCIAKIIDNRGRTDYIQKEDVEDLSDLDIGDKIFHSFLDMKYSRLTNIINLKRRQHKDSAYRHAAETATKHSNRSITRQFVVNHKEARRSSWHRQQDANRWIKFWENMQRN